MRAGLKPYPEYKESGVPWLGRVPQQWGIAPAMAVLRPREERNVGLREMTVLSLSYGKIIVKPDERLRGLIPASFETYQLVNPGDIIVRGTDLQNDQTSLRVGFARHRGIITSAYQRLVPQAELQPEFAYQLLNGYDILKVFYALGAGLRQSLGFEDIRRMPVLVPAPTDQRAIISFLRRLDIVSTRLIRAKRRMIELLNEQRQAIVQHAVTRGLDSNVSLKPSGIFWLPHVPSHWEVRSIKREFSCLNSRRIPLNGSQRGAMTRREYDYYGASGVIDRVEDYLFDEALLLIAEDGANLVLRNLPLAIIARGQYWVNNHAHVLRPRHGSIEYFAHLLEGIDYRPWITGAAQPKLTADRILNIPIPVPPIVEQVQIACAVEERTRDLRATIDRARREVDLIREYRTRLIADVVTGKLDVRHVEVPEVEDFGPEGLDPADDAPDAEEPEDEEGAA